MTRKNAKQFDPDFIITHTERYKIICRYFPYKCFKFQDFLVVFIEWAP